MKKIWLVLFLSGSFNAFSQDLSFGRKMVDTLTAPCFWGRGYTNDGMKKAAAFLAAQFKSYGLAPMDGKDYYQPFTFPVNTFPGKMQVTVNGTDLVPGKDYIISPESKGVKASGKLDQLDSIQYINRSDMVVFKMQDKLTWDVAQEVAPYTLILLDKKALAEPPLQIQSKY